MEYLARELAHYDYSVLTGKTLFKRVGDGIAEIPFLLAHVASLLI